MNHKRNDRKQSRTEPRASAPTNIQAMLMDMQAMNVDPAEFDAIAAKDGELANAHDDPEDAGILDAACRILASGYKAELSRGEEGSLFVRAAHQLLHRFLERQFARHSRAA
jgi:hypothetical protein